MSAKQLAKDFFKIFGVRVTRLTRNDFFDSENGYAGVRALMKGKEENSVFFDVGANTGQTVSTLRHYFPMGTIHAFEPGKTAFQQLNEKFSGQPKIHVENLALGAKNESKDFFENNESTMSSFLPLGKNGWGEVVNTTQVDVTTIDDYCREKSISHINLLKSDTQGFELEVLKGAIGMLKQNKVEFIFLEINFVELYKNLPSFCDINGFLSQHGFKLLRFYDFSYYENALGWTDTLFYNPQFNQTT